MKLEKAVEVFIAHNRLKCIHNLSFIVQFITLADKVDFNTLRVCHVIHGEERREGHSVKTNYCNDSDRGSCGSFTSRRR